MPRIPRLPAVVAWMAPFTAQAALRLCGSWMLSARGTEGAPPEAWWLLAPACLPQNSYSMPSLPVYRDGRHGEPELLASCYRTCLALAEQHAIHTITFPSISTGAYGYPIRDAAQIALQETTGHLRLDTSRLSQVIFVLFSEADYRAYASLFEEGGPARLAENVLQWPWWTPQQPQIY
jgi:hypothetical protein